MRLIRTCAVSDETLEDFSTDTNFYKWLVKDFTNRIKFYICERQKKKNKI